MQIVYEKMIEFTEDDDEVEINGLNWYVIIFYLLNWDWKRLYDNLYDGKDSYGIENLISLNEDFNRNDYYIFNDTDDHESFYSDKLEDCVALAADKDKEMYFKKISKNKQFELRNVSFKKGDFILYNDFKKIQLNGKFYDDIKGEFRKYNRDSILSSILSENRILRFHELKIK